jgi:carboxyl-terminal processing protease
MNRLFQRSFSISVGTVFVLLTSQQALPQSSVNSRIPVFLPEANFAQLANSPVSTALINEVWQIVNQSYIDSNFNAQDWDAIRQKFLQQSYDSNEVLYQSIQEMLASLGDPLTRFIPPEEFKAMQTSSDSLAGIGLQFRQENQTNELVVVDSIENSPARKAEILSGDILVNIDGTDMRGIGTEEAVSLLRGRVGTPVTLRVQRGQRQIEFRIVREKVEIRPVSYRQQDSRIGSIGYIRLTQFSATTTKYMQAAISDLELQGVKGYILDLRYNPGGLYNTSIDVARLWINQGTIVSKVDRRRVSEQEKATGTALTGKPLVVLVNGGSASASEILAGALQDNQRALLVGTETAGNNSIQSVRALSNGSGLAVTVEKWYPPDGRDIVSSGLIPDVRVALTEAQLQTLFQNVSLLGTPDDPQYAAALSVLITKLSE